MTARDTFVDFVLDQLAPLGKVTCRRMFGGHGLYHRGRFFAIVSRGQLFMKTDEATRPRYVAAGTGPFRPSAAQTLKNYYEVPASVLEDDEELAAWAREAAAVGGGETCRRPPSAGCAARRS